MRRLAAILALLALPAYAQDASVLIPWVLASMPAASGNPYAAYSPVATWYPSKTLDYADMVSGITATNNSRTGVVVGANGFTFNGLAGSYLDFGRTIDFGTNMYIALSAWVAPTSSASMGIIGRTYYGPHTNGRFAISRKFISDVEGILQVNNTMIDASANNTVTNGKWSHVALTLDREPGGYLRLWQNGTNAYSRIISASEITNLSMAISSINPFLIGSFGAPNAYRFVGSIDLSAVWIGNTAQNWTNMIGAIYSLGRTP